MTKIKTRMGDFSRFIYESQPTHLFPLVTSTTEKSLSSKALVTLNAKYMQTRNWQNTVVIMSHLPFTSSTEIS